MQWDPGSYSDRNYNLGMLASTCPAHPESEMCVDMMPKASRAFLFWAWAEWGVGWVGWSVGSQSEAVKGPPT